MKHPKNISLNNSFFNSRTNIYWKNNQGVYLGCNLSHALTLGLNSPAAIVGKNDFELLLNEDAVICRKNDLYVLDAAKPDIIEETSHLKEIPRIYQSHKIPLINKKNVVMGVFGISTDITDTISAQKKTETYREAIALHENIAFNNLSPQELKVVKMLATGKPRKIISKEKQYRVIALHYQK